jgi:UDP-glucose 4-epimerase
LEGHTVNIGSGSETRILDLAELILAKTGSDSSISFGPPRPGDLPRLVADTTRIESHLSFELSIDLDEGLDRTIEHFMVGDVEGMLAEEVESTWI